MIWHNADGQHAEYTLLMSLVLDDEASEAEAARLRAHVASCDACAQRWLRWQELDRKFDLAPMLPAPMDFSVVVAARLDQHAAEHARRRWFMVSLALSWVAAIVVAVVALALVNGWRLPLQLDSGPLNAAWTGLAGMAGWFARAVIAFVEQTGAPTVAAGAGVLLCVTCALATVWLWMVARLTPASQRGYVGGSLQ